MGYLGCGVEIARGDLTLPPMCSGPFEATAAGAGGGGGGRHGSDCHLARLQNSAWHAANDSSGDASRYGIQIRAFGCGVVQHFYFFRNGYGHGQRGGPDLGLRAASLTEAAAAGGGGGA